MLPLLLTILTASLIGNLHCAGMCGAFVAFSLRLHDPALQKRRPWLLAAYNLGRLLTYLALGVLFGYLGNALDHAGALAGLSRTATLLASAIMILFSLATLLRLSGVKLPKVSTPRVLHALLAKGYNHAAALPPFAHALAIGLLTTLLPCGWLYAFVAVAASTASPLAGAAVMAVFWLGTLPLLVTLGLTLHKLTDWGGLARQLPFITATAVFVVALYTLAHRLQAAPTFPTPSTNIHQQADDLGKTPPSCCAPKKGAAE